MWLTLQEVSPARTARRYVSLYEKYVRKRRKSGEQFDPLASLCQYQTLFIEKGAVMLLFSLPSRK